MNTASIIVLGIVIICAVISLRFYIKGRKKGGCCGNCADCPGCGFSFDKGADEH